MRLVVLFGLDTGRGSCIYTRGGWDYPNPPESHGMLEGSSPSREKGNSRWLRQSYMFARSFDGNPTWRYYVPGIEREI